MSITYSDKPLVDKLGVKLFNTPEFVNKPTNVVELQMYKQ